VGQALCQYAKEKEIELVVVGSRGMGAWKRSLMSAMGLGSVSDFL
jgi:nucleotide-binding universal stress UspA family protein